MATSKDYRAVTPQEIETLIGQGCSAPDWAAVEVAEPFNALRVRNCHFAGPTKIGVLDGNVDCGGIEKASGIYGAYLENCTLGDRVRVANVGVHVANYDIGDGACVENVGRLETNPATTFGNGTEVEVLNEGGGREVTLYNELSSQIAYLTCVHRYRAELVERLNAFIAEYVESVRADVGTIGAGALVRSVKEMIDVCVGDFAVVDGAASLVNGTILSSRDAPTTVGVDVQADGFIIAEGAKVTGGAMMIHSFVGQGSQMGKQYSAENSLFFANCEAFHGEACSVFGGPYTVTHHKSTLLIAGIFSFYNAGSGTNQSNHMYKLGPLHEGKLDRGAKTGSFSYMMWPCRVGPFSVVLGKHTRTFDTSEFPFSHIEAKADGKCSLIPGMNLSTVGTVRDGAKWPTRDRRTGAVKRDRIVFDVFSPYTVGKMIHASAKLKKLQDNTDRSVDVVPISGAEVKRVLLRTGQKFYRAGIHGYLLEQVVAKAESAVESGAKSVADAMASDPKAVDCNRWIDVGGQMMPKLRLDELADATASGQVATLDAFNQRLDEIFQLEPADRWAWVKTAFAVVFGKKLDEATSDDLAGFADELLKTNTKFLNLILRDAEKEFGDMSRAGFGQDGDPADADTDFLEVRGRYEDDKFVKKMQADVEDLNARVAKFKQTVAPSLA